MTDILQITGLNIKTRIGIHEWEQRILQVLLIDIRIEIDLSACNNQLENTIDYDALCQRVTTFVESQNFSLIETVAEKVAEVIKEEFKVATVRVSVSKPHAVKNAANISIVVNR